MPELPEIEVTRLGVAPHVENHQVTDLVLRATGLRWPFPAHLKEKIVGQVIRKTGRRGKYLLLHFDHGVLIFHLGMSGHLRVLPLHTAPQKHDHVDLVLENQLIRMTDPRRFGAVLWHDNKDGDVNSHPLLIRLGVEPLTDAFTPELLYRATRNRHAAIKQVLLAGDIVVGVGNIYASESLFKAGIRPTTAAHRISLTRYTKLVQTIRSTLQEAILQGGSTLRDFIGVNGQSGYFQQNYFVYARAGEPCRVCGSPVKQIKQGQRSSFYCGVCQR